MHALDLARFLAGARGEPLAEASASTSAWTTMADYPLVASLAGTLPNGLRIEAAADLRGDAPFQLEIVIDGRRIDLSGREWPAPYPESADALDAEYAGLVGHFVTAMRVGAVDRVELQEVLETHRELILASRATDTCGVDHMPQG
jgi:hypothetical protein